MIPIAKPYLTEEEARSAYDTVLSGWVMQGPRVEEFENRFREYTGAKFAAAVSNCTTALHLSMLVSEIGPGDEVICPSLSYIATANCIRFVGANPVFAEVDPNTYNIDPNHAESLINDKTKAILIVHQIGMPADIDRFRLLAEKYRIKLIEDAACAAGSVYKGKKIGSHSSLVCFSFHPRKVITTGEGGMITTDDQHYYERIKLLRQHAMTINSSARHLSGKFVIPQHVELGYNYRMTDIQAAIGVKQISKLDWILSERRKIADRYFEGLNDIKSITLPVEAEGYCSNFQSYMIYLKENSPVERDHLIEMLLNDGISSSRGIVNSHKEKTFRQSCAKLELPVSERVADRTFIVPLFVPMDDKDLLYIISRLRKHLLV